jgi:hypothetical protein
MKLENKHYFQNAQLASQVALIIIFILLKELMKIVIYVKKLLMEKIVHFIINVRKILKNVNFIYVRDASRVN